MKMLGKHRIEVVRLLVACILFFGYASPVFANDSNENQLLAKLSRSKPAERVAILNQLAQYYCDFSYTQALKFTEQAIALADSLNDSKGLAQALYTNGLIHQLQGENSDAYKRLKQAYTLFSLSKDSLGIAKTGDCLGALFRYYGAYEKSLEYHFRSLNIFRKVKDTTGLISALNNLGIVYRSLENYPRSISYYQQALGLAKESHSNLLSTVYNSIGSYYWYSKEFSNAVFYYRSALGTPPITLALKERHCAALNNLGNVYRSMEQLDSALYFYGLSKKESKQYGFINLLAITLKNYGITYTQLGDFDKATNYFKQSILLSKKADMKQVLRDNYLLLSNLFIKQGDYKQAWEYQRQYSTIQDSIYNDEQSSKVALLEVDYLIQQKEKNLAILMRNSAEKNLEIQRSRNLLLISILIISLLILLAFGFFRLFRINKKASKNLLNQNEELEARVKRRTEKLEREIANHKITAIELVKAKEKAEESDRLKSTFLSNLSHEIRTPMHAIVGFTDLLANSDLKESDRDQYISIINKSGNYLLSIINDLIEISKIEAGQMLVHNSSVEVNSLLEELYSSFQAQIPKEKEITLVLSIPPKRLTISTDAIKLRQVLANLIGNAIKFTEIGSITLGYHASGERELNFFVADTGIGIDEANTKIIFNRFRKVEGDNAIAQGGSGLGLAISKAYVELLGGSISLQSQVGRGSTFSFTLPLIPAERKVEMKD